MPFLWGDSSNAFNYYNNSKTMDRRIRGCENHHLLRHCRMTGSGSSEIIRVDFSLFPPLSRLQFTSDCFYCGRPGPVVLCKGAHFRSCNTKGEVNPLPQAFGSWFKKALKQQSSVTINSGNPLSTRLNPPIHNARGAPRRTGDGQKDNGVRCSRCNISARFIRIAEHHTGAGVRVGGCVWAADVCRE